ARASCLRSRRRPHRGAPRDLRAAPPMERLARDDHGRLHPARRALKLRVALAVTQLHEHAMRLARMHPRDVRSWAVDLHPMPPPGTSAHSKPTRYTPSPRLARNRPTALEGWVGCISSMWPMPVGRIAFLNPNPSWLSRR